MFCYQLSVRSLSRLSKSVWLALVGWLKNGLRCCVALIYAAAVFRCGPTLWTPWAWGDGRNVVTFHTSIALKWLCSAFEVSVNLAFWSCSADWSLNCKSKRLCLICAEKTGLSRLLLMYVHLNLQLCCDHFCSGTEYLVTLAVCRLLLQTDDDSVFQARQRGSLWSSWV